MSIKKGIEKAECKAGLHWFSPSLCFEGPCRFGKGMN